MDYPDLNVFIKDNGPYSAERFILDVSSPFLCSLVQSACLSIIDELGTHCGYTDARSRYEDLKKPNFTAAPKWEQRLWCAAAYDSVYAGRIFQRAVRHAEIINVYVTWKNNNSEKYLIGEEMLMGLAYQALVMLQNFKVYSIKEEHKARGKDFGSATEWQQKDVAEPVRDWPEKYDFKKYLVYNETALPLPKDEPGYEEN